MSRKPEPDDTDAASDGAEPAGIAYLGVAGSSFDCLDAIEGLIQCRVQISRTLIITADQEHGLLLTTSVGDPIAIKSGFASGYGGTGPRTFSIALQLLDLFDAEIDEVVTDEALLIRLDRAALTRADLDLLAILPVVRPSRWRDYVTEEDFDKARDGRLTRQLSPVMPFAIIDPRIADLARTFWTDSDARLTVGYRRLEDIVRTRTGLKASSSKLFSEAFGDKGPLTWAVEDSSERVGRMHLFTGVFMAYRNPRAHSEPADREALAEFLLLNQLFILEAEAVDREPNEEGPKA